MTYMNDNTSEPSRLGESADLVVKKKWYKRGWVWFWLIVFWPIGIYGLYKRVRVEKRKWYIFAVIFIVFIGFLTSFGQYDSSPTFMTESKAKKKCYDMFHQYKSYSITLNSMRMATIDKESSYYFVLSNFGDPVVGYMKCNVYEQDSLSTIEIKFY